MSPKREQADDEARAEVERIAQRAGGDPTPHDLMRLSLAISHDQQAAHRESMGLLSEVVEVQRDVKTVLEKLEANGESREQRIQLNTERITSLEVAATVCPAGLSDALEKAHAKMMGEHDVLHAEHMADFHVAAVHRKEDAPDSDYRVDREQGEQAHQTFVMWLIASAVGRVLIFAAGGVVLLLVEYLIRGHW